MGSSRKSPAGARTWRALPHLNSPRCRIRTRHAPAGRTTSVSSVSPCSERRCVMCRRSHLRPPLSRSKSEAPMARGRPRKCRCAREEPPALHERTRRATCRARDQQQRLGTGHGRSEYAPTQHVAFERAQSIRRADHDSLRQPRQLIAMGAIPQPRVRHGRARIRFRALLASFRIRRAAGNHWSVVRGADMSPLNRTKYALARLRLDVSCVVANARDTTGIAALCA